MRMILFVALVASFTYKQAVAQPPGAGDFVEGGTEQYRVGIVTGLPGITSGRYGVWAGPAHAASLAIGRSASILEFDHNCSTCDLGPGGNFSFVRSYGSATDYRLGSVTLQYPFAADPGFDCVDANLLADPVVEQVFEAGAAVGVRSSWDVINASDDLLVELLLKVHGQDSADSAVEVSLRVVNRSDAEAALGLRHWWPLSHRFPVPTSTIGSNWFLGTRPPDPAPVPYTTTETEWVSPSFRMWELNTDQPDPRLGQEPYLIGAAMSGPDTLEPQPTPPDLLQQCLLNPDGVFASSGGGAGDSCFYWRVPDPPRPVRPGGGRMGIVSYWGQDETSALSLAPGGEVTVTQYLVAYPRYPVQVSANGPYEALCVEGSGAAVLDGRSLIDPPTSADVQHLWSSTDPRVSFDEPGDPRTVVRAEGAGSFPIEYRVSIGVFEASAATTLEVVDLAPPRFRRLSVSPPSLWPPNHKMQEVEVSLDVDDNCDSAPAVRLVAVQSNQLERWLPGAGAGHTNEDIADAELGFDDRRVSLRAERNGSTRGPRSYRLTYEVRDEAGNVSEQSVTVAVAHDRRRMR